MASIPKEELERLKEKNRQQARQLKILNECLAAKNVELDAMHFVWCSGGCSGGVHRYVNDVVLSEALILKAERNVKRMRAWYNTLKWRLTRYPTLSEWDRKYADRAVTKTDLAPKQ